MPETFRVTKAKYAGEKPNPHGGTLYKFYVALQGSEGAVHGDPDENKGIYWQRKSAALEVGEEVYGHIEDGEYGPRFKTDQRPDGAGNFKTPDNLKPVGVYRQEGPDPQAERSRRIERQHSQEMALRLLAHHPYREGVDYFRTIKSWTDWFVADLDADVGGGNRTAAGVEAHTAAADVSAKSYVEQMKDAGLTPPNEREASPAQKGKLTNLFNKAGLSRDAMKAVVLYRCRSEKATKEGASQLITDLQEGATHDQLLAEIHDAKRAGDPLAKRAAELIPSEMPWEDDGSLPPAPEKESDEPVPF